MLPYPAQAFEGRSWLVAAPLEIMLKDIFNPIPHKYDVITRAWAIMTNVNFKHLSICKSPLNA